MSFFRTTGQERFGTKPKDVYISLRSGLDSGNCGGFYNPCKTLKQGVKRSDWRGRVLLMGTDNLDRQLYTCESTAFGQRDRVLIDKNLTLQYSFFPPESHAVEVLYSIVLLNSNCTLNFKSL